MMAGTNLQADRWSSGDSRPGTVLATNRLLLLAAVPLFLILAICAYLTIQFAANERAAQGWVRHTYQVISQLGRVLGDAQDAETGQRGYLLTRRPEFLEPYHAARNNIAQDMRRLRDLTRDNPAQTARAQVLQRMISDRFQAFDHSLDEAIQGRSADTSPALLAALEEGKRRMDALRDEIGRGIAEEQSLLRQRDAETNLFDQSDQQPGEGQAGEQRCRQDHAASLPTITARLLAAASGTET